MKKVKIKRRWIAVLIFFFFLLFNQFDAFLLEPVANQIFTTWNISSIQLKPITTISLVLGIISFIVWGWLYDKYNRKQLLILACILWAINSWLLGISPTFGTFAISYIISIVDNASFSGVFSIISDYFRPRNRGKVIGLLYISCPTAYFTGNVLVNIMAIEINWLWVLCGVGLVASILAALINYCVPEPRRGGGEPALKDVEITGVYLKDRERFKGFIKQRGLILLSLIGFFTTIPWTAITGWMVSFLQDVQGFPVTDIIQILFPALTALTLGFPIGGLFGDYLTRFSIRGRAMVSLLSVGLSILLLLIVFHTDSANIGVILLFVFLAFFISFEKPNSVAMVFDITLPEIRSEAVSILMLHQFLGTLTGSSLVRHLLQWMDLRSALLFVCLGAWGISLLLLICLFMCLPGEVEELRKHMAYRRSLEERLQTKDAAKLV